MSEKIKPSNLSENDLWQVLASAKATEEINGSHFKIPQTAVQIGKYRFLSVQYPDLTLSLSQKIADDESKLIESLINTIKDRATLNQYLELYSRVKSAVSRLQNPEDILNF